MFSDYLLDHVIITGPRYTVNVSHCYVVAHFIKEIQCGQPFCS